MAEAMDRTPHRPMSSRTAEPSCRLAKRVWRMPRSEKILVITGIDVTAAAAAKTRITADSLPAVPMNRSSGSSGATSRAKMNGSGVPRPRMKAVALRFSLPSRCLAARSGHEHQHQHAEVVEEAEDDGLGVGLVGAEDVGGEAGGDLPEERGAEQDAGQDLADHLGLAQLGEELPEEVGAQHQQEQGEDGLAQVLIRHHGSPAESGERKVNAEGERSVNRISTGPGRSCFPANLPWKGRGPPTRSPVVHLPLADQSPRPSDGRRSTRRVRTPSSREAVASPIMAKSM